MEQFTLSASGGGAEIPVFVTVPGDASRELSTRSAVQYIHGMGDRAARNEELYDTLAASGYAVYAADLPGHGLRRDGAVFLGRRGGCESVISECHDLRHEIERRHPSVPRFVIGHSMGTLFARITAAESPDSYRGVVLSGPVGPLGPLRLLGLTTGVIGRLFRGPRRANRLFAALSFGQYAKSVPDRRTDEDWLSRDPAEVDAYRADPLLGEPFSSAFVSDLMRAVGRAHATRTILALAGAKTDSPPALFILAGGADPVAEDGAVARRIAEDIRGAGNTDVHYHVYPGARHDLFHEFNRGEVFRDLTDWLNARSD